MYTQVDKSNDNKSRAVANSVAQQKSNGKQGFGFVDNRHEAVVQRKLNKIANEDTQEQQSLLVYSKKQGAKFLEGNKVDGVIQGVLDVVPAPKDSDVKFLMYASDVWDAFRKKWGDEHKGLHGTSIWSAINMMTKGIRVNNVKRTSSVTPGAGFYVDKSEDGNAHANDFADMAAYGEQETATDQEYLADAKAATEKTKAFEDEMKKVIADGHRSNRSVVLNVWGPKKLEPREKLDRTGEDIYESRAGELVVTVKSIK
jgi:hypothetical protein